MKTAEDWISQVHEKPFLLDSENRKFIRAIQIDALRESAEIADRMAVSSDSINVGRVRSAILSRIKELEK